MSNVALLVCFCTSMAILSEFSAGRPKIEVRRRGIRPRILNRIADARGRKESCQDRGRQEGWDLRTLF